MTQGSILNTTKKMLGLAENYDAFDTDVVMHINAALSTLTQLGVGPHEGFEIEDAAPVWEDLIGESKNLGLVRSYVFLRVRMLFDPPTNSFLVESFKEQIQEFEWRINVIREHYGWIDPTVEPAILRTNQLIDGGTP